MARKQSLASDAKGHPGFFKRVFEKSGMTYDWLWITDQVGDAGT